MATQHVHFQWHPPSSGGGDVDSVELCGSFSNWKDRIPLERDSKTNAWRTKEPLSLPPGSHQYKFVINRTQWTHDPRLPVVRDSGGNVNNVCEVSSAPPSDAAGIGMPEAIRPFGAEHPSVSVTETNSRAAAAAKGGAWSPSRPNVAVDVNFDMRKQGWDRVREALDQELTRYFHAEDEDCNRVAQLEEKWRQQCQQEAQAELVSFFHLSSRFNEAWEDLRLSRQELHTSIDAALSEHFKEQLEQRCYPSAEEPSASERA
ncbi:putative 5'-AMP-activated protein kinase; regulatory beta subunit [Paratrimastix pyriformis]|uniref:5'-AMP-activated protein kinase n=1 Tax=Paratrimastix pyriformis TaxID=342808 RepID=A0ABQ8UCY4_9EUKA|nr:putative 5'-AMP-activated protein kinase; regulatory beta subunit [Paratrimastix pyriformis]